MPRPKPEGGVWLVALAMQPRHDGINVYVRSLGQALAAQAGERDFSVLAQPELWPRPPEPWRPPLAWLNRHALGGLFWHQVVLPLLAAWRRPALVHVPTARRIPFFCPATLVITAHDLAAARVDNKYDPARGLFNRQVIPRLLRRAALVITPSQATARDLEQVAGLAAEKVRVVPEGVAGIFQPRPRGPALASLRQRYDLGPEPLLLYVARLEHPGKNHLALLEALAMLLGQGRSLQLALVGAMDQRGQRVLQAIGEMGLGGRVRHFQGVPQEDLALFYNAATALAHPSLHEGFGLPILEAFASGLPVVSSRGGSLAEVAGQAALLFDPGQPRELAQALGRLLDDEGLAADLSRRGLARAAEFSWSQAAAATWAAYALARELDR